MQLSYVHTGETPYDTIWFWGHFIPGVASWIAARSHTFVEIDHEIISTVILLPSAESFKKGCCQLQGLNRKYVHKVLVNCLLKLAQEKVWFDELTVPPWP